MVDNERGVDDDQFEIDLYIIRRRIEKQVLDNHITGFYICSLSCRSLIYKGMFLAEQLTAFYPDLLDERFVSRFAIFHQRYSTNTFPTWRLAQPFRMLAHNGEINTIRGNKNWMASHEARAASDVFGAPQQRAVPADRAGRLGFDGAGRRAGRRGARGPHRAVGLQPADSGCLVQEAGNARQAPGPLQLLQLRDGALGRPGGDRCDRRDLDPRRHGPQRAPPDALQRHGRRNARRGLGDRHGPDRARGDRRERPPRPGSDDLRRPRRRAALSQPRDQGHARGRQALRGLGRRRGGRERAGRRPDRAPALLTRGLAPAPADGGLYHGGAGAPAPSHGGHRQGADRFDGRRHAARRALGPVPGPARLLPPDVRAGDQPADRFVARIQRHEPAHPARQHGQTSSPTSPSRPRCCSSIRRSLPTANSRA